MVTYRYSVIHTIIDAASRKEIAMFPDKLPIKGVYEIAIRVKDLSVSEPFYTNVLGLEIGIRDTKRNWLFLRAGGEAGMIVLQEDSGDWPRQHFAFTIDESDIERAAASLSEAGVKLEGPMFHEWMPATSLYFEDPDGNQLELCAPRFFEAHKHRSAVDEAGK